MKQKKSSGYSPERGCPCHFFALARTLIKGADLYIFDEPNASLDLVSEQAVLHSIYRETKGKIRLLIMHRFSPVILKADQIIVLDQGHIQESGTHEELLKKEGIYYRLWHIQNSESGEEENIL